MKHSENRHLHTHAHAHFYEYLHNTISILQEMDLVDGPTTLLTVWHAWIHRHNTRFM